MLVYHNGLKLSFLSSSYEYSVSSDENCNILRYDVVFVYIFPVFRMNLSPPSVRTPKTPIFSEVFYIHR